MDLPITPLADGFEPASHADWLALVAKTLKGAGAETLVSPLADGLELEALYDRPRNRSETQFVPAPRDGDGAWDIRAEVRHPDPAVAHDAILAALSGGAASVLVRIDPAGQGGVAVGSADAFARLLDGVLVDVAPVALDAGFLGPQAADWLALAAKASPAAPLALHLDPLSAFAAAGASPGPIESALFAAANTAARLAPTYPAASLFLAGGRAVHEAGGTPAEELAFAAAAALAYAKAMARAGLPLETAFGSIVVGLAVDADPLISIAKLRATRIVWGKLTGACGISKPARIEASSSRRMLTRADPWTNLVRLTAAGFAAAVGGADAVALGAFTDALGLPTPFAERMARNTQLILMDEGHVGAVRDPAAGSGAFETLSKELARVAWRRFSAIEAAGGIVTALREGMIAKEVESGRAELAAALAEKRARIVGVTDFVNADPAPAALAAARDVPPAAGPDPRLPGPDSHCPTLKAIALEDLAG